MTDRIINHIEKSIACKQVILQEMVPEILGLSVQMTDTLKQGNKIFLCGNGGSAADAQHIAAELSGRYKQDRAPLPVEALTVNSSALTAIANDYGFEQVYARLLEAHGSHGDLVICISTSGNSPNILAAAKAAKRLNIQSIALTGKTGGDLAKIANHTFKVPSTDTPIIQESHIMIGHVLCDLIEQKMFSS